MPSKIKATIVMVTGRLMTRLQIYAKRSIHSVFGFSNCHLSMRSPSAISTEGNNVTEVRTAIADDNHSANCDVLENIDPNKHHCTKSDEHTKCRKNNGSSCCTNGCGNSFMYIAFFTFFTVAADEQQSEVDTECKSEHRNDI